MNKYGEVLYNVLTDEPCIVLREFRYLTLVHRPIMGQDGIRYRLGIFPSCELETLQEQTQRTLATIKARNAIAAEEMDVADGPLAMPAGLSFKKMN